MLKPGILLGDALEAGSMARAIEDAMVVQGVLQLEDETPDAAEMRRKAFIAIATGVINHLKSNVVVTIPVNKLAADVPATTVTLTAIDNVMS